MAIRTSITAVKTVIEVPTNLLDATITQHIADASLLVDEQLSSAGLSDARLELVERYIAAHLITVLTERGGFSSSEVDNSKDTYGIKAGMGLAMTRYGQMAIGFDTTGTLKAMASDPGKGLNAQFRVL